MKFSKFLMKIVRYVYSVNRANKALYIVIGKLHERNNLLLNEIVELEYYQGFKPLSCNKYRKQG